MWEKCARGGRGRGRGGGGEPSTGIKDATILELGPQSHISGGLLDPATRILPLTSKSSLTSSLHKPRAREPHTPAVCTVYSVLPRSFIEEYTLNYIRNPTITEGIFLK